MSPVGWLILQNMALKEEDGPLASGPGPLSSLHLCQLPRKSSSSPPAPWSWDKCIVLLSKPLIPFWTEGRRGG